MRWLIFIFLMLWLPLFSCSRRSSLGSSRVRLVMWVTYQEEELGLFRQIVRSFAREYRRRKGLEVEVVPQRVPFHDLTTYIRLAAMAGKTPDIARVDALKVVDMAYHKVLVRLDELSNFDASSWREKGREFLRVPFMTNVVNIRGEVHLYGLPEQTTCLALFWNKDLFAKVGLDPERPPRTWEELIAFAKRLTYTERRGGVVRRYYGFAMRNSLWWTMPFFACFGAKLFQTDGRGRRSSLLGDRRACAAFQLKVDLYRKYRVEAGAWKSGAISPELGFLSNRYAMILMGPWATERFRARGIRFGVGLIPRIGVRRARQAGIVEAGEIPRSGTNIGGNNLVIFRSSRHKEIAYDFIRYFTSYEVQKLWCLRLKQIPVHRRVYEELRSRSGSLGVFMRQIRYAILPPSIPGYGRLEADIVNPEMELALQGKKTVQEALQSASERVQREILERINR
ncbi:MAG: extracellular solute-binding protein [Planctomycetota bacterium]|nr:MAG: extracellular solute-binding protein [Planctomycetota bacterium]